MIAQNVTELIGNTPLLKLNSVSQNATILGKCEFLNPTHSIKDRIAYNMIKTALDQGIITKGSQIIEPTSGNTGIGLAMVCAAFELKLTLTMPSSMSLERRKLLKALGAELVLTEPEKGMKGAVEKAKELAMTTPDAYMPQQFNNEANAQMHEKTTAKEILEATGGKVDVFVAAVGTGGTITGVGRVLKAHNPNIKIYAVEPDASPVLSGGNAGPHKIQGIGAGFIPEVLDTGVYDEVVKVSFEDAVATSRSEERRVGKEC